MTFEWVLFLPLTKILSLPSLYTTNSIPMNFSLSLLIFDTVVINVIQIIVVIYGASIFSFFCHCLSSLLFPYPFFMAVKLSRFLIEGLFFRIFQQLFNLRFYYGVSQGKPKIHTSLKYKHSLVWVDLLCKMSWSICQLILHSHTDFYHCNNEELIREVWKIIFWKGNR